MQEIGGVPFIAEVSSPRAPVSSERSWSRAALLARRGKIAAHQLQRWAQWWTEAEGFPAPTLAPPAEQFPIVAYDRLLAVGRRDPHADPVLEEGKRINLALAAPSFDGLLLEPTRPLSFWRTLGRVTEQSGYRYGMELHGGCVVPAIGGGLCLLSNALFEMAAQLGWRILERHGHSAQAVPPAPGELWGVDATVFYPYVDLRLAPERAPARLEVRVHGDSLRLTVRTATPPSDRFSVFARNERLEQTAEGTFRCNEIARQRLDPSGSPIGTAERIAVNRKRIVPAAELSRSCRSCGEMQCHLRATLPAELVR